MFVNLHVGAICLMDLVATTCITGQVEKARNFCEYDTIAQQLLALYNNNTETMQSKLFGSTATFTKLKNKIKWNEGITTLYNRPFYVEQFKNIENGMRGNGFYRQFGIGGIGKTATSLMYIIELGRREVVLLYICMGRGKDVGAMAYLLKKGQDGMCSSYCTTEFDRLIDNIPKEQELWIIVDAVDPVLAIDRTSKFNSRQVLYVASGRMAMEVCNNIKEEPYFRNSAPVESITKAEFLQLGFESAYPLARRLLLTGIDNSEDLVDDAFARELTKEETDKIHCRLAYMYDLFGGNIRHLLHCLLPDIVCTPDDITQSVNRAMETVDPRPRSTQSPTRAGAQFRDWDALVQIRTACKSYVMQILSRFVQEPAKDNVTAGTTSLFYTIVLVDDKLKVCPASPFLADVNLELDECRKKTMLSALERTIGNSGLGFLYEYSSIRCFLTYLRRGRTVFVAMKKKAKTDKLLELEAVDLYVTSVSTIQDLSALQVGDFAISTNPCFPFIDGCVVLNNQVFLINVLTFVLLPTNYCAVSVYCRSQKY